MSQYAVTRKNGACLLTTDKEEALRDGEKNRSEVILVKPERKVIAFPMWVRKGDTQPYYTRGAKYVGLIIDD